MASYMSWFGGRKDPKQSARDAIVTLRQQLQMIEKKEEYLQKKIEDELKKAKANAITNKAAAKSALQRKKASEVELDRLAGTRMQLETNINTLESANLNAETMQVLKKASDALKVIHGKLTMEQVDATMAAVNEQRELANEVAEAISNPIYGQETDDDELRRELEELEQDAITDRLSGADRVPIHQPAGRVAAAPVEDDEEEELRKLQAELAM